MNAFPKHRRLLTKKDFSRVFNNSKKLVMPEFLLIVSPNDIGNARLGLAFSKKYLRTAILRNRIKRIFRESFRMQQLSSVDIVACARTNLASISNEKLRADLNKAWEKLTTLHARH